ncbi:hypothetical protein NLU13_4746 [Sarocladium strictum]|uniref:Uncharacterized protein n=1 Tax=Sarocladium strictum TaxID=5046 RepID=A0AA39L8Z4_SARSR|nr:hypothetical protein NLU13_4746 [Sarocladium strictum]
MKFIALSALAFAASVVADFVIYYEEAEELNPFGDTISTSSFRVFNGVPSCGDVDSYATLPAAADASSPGYSRCSGCGDWSDIANWDVQEVELHSNSDWGHYTIYKDSGYQLTPADGGDLQGSCVWDFDPEPYGCNPGGAFAVGYRLFSCTSPKGGIQGN